jgi:hypothetical protein
MTVYLSPLSPFRPTPYFFCCDFIALRSARFFSSSLSLACSFSLSFSLSARFLAARFSSAVSSAGASSLSNFS